MSPRPRKKSHSQSRLEGMKVRNYSQRAIVERGSSVKRRIKN